MVVFDSAVQQTQALIGWVVQRRRAPATGEHDLETAQRDRCLASTSIFQRLTIDVLFSQRAYRRRTEYAALLRMQPEGGAGTGLLGRRVVRRSAGICDDRFVESLRSNGWSIVCRWGRVACGICRAPMGSGHFADASPEGGILTLENFSNVRICQ